MQVFLIAYVLAALGVSALLLLSRRPNRGRRVNWPNPVDAAAFGPFDIGSQTDVAAAVSVALGRLEPTLAGRGGRIDIAVRPGLIARIPGHELANAVQDTLAEMLERPSHRMVLSAARQGGQVAITIADDVPCEDAVALDAALVPLASRIALRGGALTVGTAGGRGASVTIRLAAMPRGPSPVQNAPEAPLPVSSLPISSQQPGVARVG